MQEFARVRVQAPAEDGCYLSFGLLRHRVEITSAAHPVNAVAVKSTALEKMKI